jgi:hypothetical protein
VPHNPRGGPEQDSIDSAHMSHIGFRCSREPEPPGAMPMWVRP